jgi:hypothetical protein
MSTGTGTRVPGRRARAGRGLGGRDPVAGGLDGGRRTCGAGNEAGVDLGSAGS